MDRFETADWVIELKRGARPKEVVMEISTLCEFKCVHCFRWSAKNFKETYMEMDKFSRILENLVRSGVEKVALTGWGEPTTHPDFEWLLKSLRSRGLRVVLNTNGYRLSKLYRVVAENVDEIVVSIDAATLELYGRMRVGGVLPEVVESLKKVVELKRLELVTRPTIKVIFTITKLNFHEAGDLLKLARELGVNEVMYSYYIPLEGERGLDCIGDTYCIKGFEESIEKAKREYPELGLRISVPQLPLGSYRSCPFAQNKALYIRVDGSVTPCLYYSRTWKTRLFGVERSINEIILGSAIEESLADIWRNEYSKLYYKLSFNEMPSCFTCVLVNYCALTRSNDGDCLGNTPTCAHCPFYHGLTFCPL
ncbi:MAG: radical SAM protein [Sulfolobales archaeon]